MAECVQHIDADISPHAASDALLRELEEAGGDGLGGPGTPTLFTSSSPSHIAAPGLIQSKCCSAAAENPAADVVLGPYAVQETCVILDWDDTIFPSSFVDRKKLIHCRGLDELPSELQRGFAELEKAAAGLITAATKYGTVLIITNAQTGWVELCVSKFMPGLMAVLGISVRVVSARSNYERYFPGDPLCWKSAAFAHELTQLQNSQGHPLKNLLSFGDSMEERTAVQIAAGHLQGARAKSVKFLDAPSPRELHQQIEVVTDCLEWIWRHNGALDVVLTLEQERHDPSQKPTDGTNKTGEHTSGQPQLQPPQSRKATTLSPISVPASMEGDLNTPGSDTGREDKFKSGAAPLVVTPSGVDEIGELELADAMHVVTDEEESEDEN